MKKIIVYLMKMIGEELLVVNMVDGRKLTELEGSQEEMLSR